MSDKEIYSIFDCFDEFYPGDMHCVPLSPCKFCGGRAFIGLQSETWLGFCGKCACVLGEPFGYASRLDLAKDWNGEQEIVPEQLDLFKINDIVIESSTEFYDELINQLAQMDLFDDDEKKQCLSWITDERFFSAEN